MDQVIAKGMAKNPDDRYATTKDFAAAARAALGGASITDHQAAPPIQDAPPSPPVYPNLSAAAPAAPSANWPAPASAPVPYPPTGPNMPSAAAPTQYSAFGQPPPPPHMGGQPPIMDAGSAPPWPPVPGSQLSQGNQQRWLIPAVLAAAVLLVIGVIAAVVYFISSQSGGPGPIAYPGKGPTDTPSASIPGFTFPSNFPSFSIPQMPGQIPGQTTGSGPQGQLLTTDGLNGLLTSMREKYGDTMGFRLVVYPEYASLQRPDPQDARRSQSYDYRGGSWSTGIIATSVGPFDHLVDLGKFDVAAVTAQIPGVPKQFNFTNPDASYLIIDGNEDGTVGVSIYSSDHGLTGYVKLNSDGTVNKVYPP
jgi:serine/threonine-protein kinase